MALFRGREKLIQQIETLLADPDRSVSISLIGPRRCGKTSLLRMLPVKLPDAICVFFDLQDNPVDSAQAFFQALERQTLEQASRDRQMTLPKLANGPIFETGSQWFRAVDEVAGTHRILICIDEFERLEELFPGDRRDLLKLMGLFRAIIQHRRRLRLLAAGAAPFDELDSLWNDHFINLREIPIGHLDRENSLNLLTRPIAGFPAQAIPTAIAKRIYDRTRGQPYLTQLYGNLLVTRLNDQKRRTALVEDVSAIEEDVLTQAAYYLRNIYQSAPAKVRHALLALSKGEQNELQASTRRWLRRRWLLDQDGQLGIPVLGRWIKEEIDD